MSYCLSFPFMLIRVDDIKKDIYYSQKKSI